MNTILDQLESKRAAPAWAAGKSASMRSTRRAS
jgi:hypothetical protein